MDALLGADRLELVDKLVESFDEVARSGAPIWWSLEAAPGWGKTRLVQELYGRLAARQQEPGYWPLSLLPPAGTVDSLRKRVAPDSARARTDGTPEFFWWGLSCLSRPGSEFEALVQDLGQFARHKSGLERRWRQLATRPERLRRAFGDRKSELSETVLGEGVGLAAGATNLAVPGLGLVLLLAKWGVQRGVSELRERQGHPAVSAGGSVAEQLGPELERLGDAGLPLVVAVEDIHAADATLIDLLIRLLMAARSRVLLVTTCWPGLINEPGRPVSTLFERAPAFRVRAGIDIGDLSVTNRAELARTALPELDGSGAALLAERYDNPLALQTVCQLGAVRRALGRGVLTAEVVRSLPADVAGLYGQLWTELPPRVQEALVLAVLSAPTSIGKALNFGDDRWDPATVQAAVAAETSLREQPLPLLGDLVAASEDYSWIRTAESWLQQFHEPAQRDVALAAALLEFAEPDRALLYRALARALSEAPALVPVRREHADRLLLTLAAAEILGPTSELLDAVARVCSRLAASPTASDHHLLLAVADLARGDDPSDPRLLQVRGHAAAALAQVGQVDRSISAYETLLTDQVRVLGPHHPDVLTTRNDLAVCWGRVGRMGDAVRGLESLLHDRERLLGPDATGSLTTRGNLGSCLGESGCVREAIEIYASLLADRSRILGPEALDTLRTRSNLAWWLGEAGRIGEAIQIYDALLPDVLRILGPDAPDSLTVWSNLANWLGEAGRTDDAVRGFTQVEQDRSRILGPDAPDSLRARGNLAWWTGESGHIEEAIDLHRSVLRDRVRVLGAEAPDTLRARGNLAWWVGKSGNVEAAVASYQELLRDQVEILGEGPQVAATRKRLAYWQEWLA